MNDSLIDIVDNDKVCISNLNRQLYALHSTIGMDKVDAAEMRIHDINPDCNVVKKDIFFLPENSSEICFDNYDYIVDAVDTVSAKIEIIECAKKAGVPVISSMGTGNKLDAAAFKVSDISKTTVCPLARIMRRELRARNISGVKVVYSEEEPKKTCSNIPASISFVPPVAGYIIAGEVIKDIIGFQYSLAIKSSIS